jgi:subtilase family serine protease
VNITLIRRRRRRRMILGACLTLAVAGSAVVGAGTAAAAPPKIQRSCAKPRPGFAACFAERLVPPKGKGKSFLSTFPGYTPAALQSAYALPSSSLGSGRTVAIVDAYDLPTAEADLGSYRSRFGLPPCTTANGCFHKINQNGGTTLPAASDGWGTEIALDIDMVSAICPLCKILLVEASSATMGDLGTAVNQAAAQGAVAISNSYGGSDGPSDSTFDALYYRHAGIAITAASGDWGYGTSYPAASQYVTAVGGTTLLPFPSIRGWIEGAWSGAGSGCSTNEAKPWWQHDTGCAGRAVADVSAVANPATGVLVYDSYGSGGGWGVWGGTSAASPIIASVYALARPAGVAVYPVRYLYDAPSRLYDVTLGNANGTCSPLYLCTPGPGYDGPTGLGTPNGVVAFGS